MLGCQIWLNSVQWLWSTTHSKVSILFVMVDLSDASMAGKCAPSLAEFGQPILEKKWIISIADGQGMRGWFAIFY